MSLRQATENFQNLLISRRVASRYIEAAEWVVYKSDKKDPIREDSKAIMAIGGGISLFALPANKKPGEDDNFDRKIVWQGRADNGDLAVQIARRKM